MPVSTVPNERDDLIQARRDYTDQITHMSFHQPEPHFATREIYIHWEGYNNSDSKLFRGPPECMETAEKYHPAWIGCLLESRR